MKAQKLHYSFFVFIVFTLHNGLSVPHEYCLTPMNKSNCNYPPTAVFSYYKPGSRCEIEIWRGCPTYNKFDDEFICSHYCIGKLFGKQDDEEEFDANGDPCAIPMKNKDCGGKPTQVFTYTDGVCSEAIWRGCPTLNKFKDKEACQIACVRTIEAWAKQIEELPVEDIEEIDQLLDDVMEDIQEVKSFNLVLELTSTKAPVYEEIDVGEQISAEKSGEQISEEKEPAEKVSEEVKKEEETEEEGVASEVVTT